MKKIGIIGGLGWPSTIDYYRLLCEKTNDYFKSNGSDLPYPSPHIILESVNMSHTRSLRGRDGDEDSWESFDNYFRATFENLKKAGAEFGMIASNTPHMRLKSIMKGLDFPIVSILEATARGVQDLGGTKALVLGTSVTMKSTVYSDTLKLLNIEANNELPEGDIAELGKIIDNDLYCGNIDGARKIIAKISNRHVDNPSKEIVCLACTELPLAFPEHQNSSSFVEDGITYFNTTVGHVEAVMEKALS